LNRSAGISAPLCSVLLAALVFGCGYRYAALRISRTADFTPMVRHQGLADGSKAHEGASASKRPGSAQKVRVPRYLAGSYSGAPFSRMNDRGVRYALEGRFREAETMFREALKDNPGFAPACNNLGVVYEIFGRRDDSFAMYSRACLIEPGNDVFRENFLNLSDSAAR
jgi:tetratricopeptide (TPR) repeat protein